MIKKILTTILIVGTSALAHANGWEDLPAQSQRHGAFYLGATLSGAFARNEVSINSAQQFNKTIAPDIIITQTENSFSNSQENLDLSTTGVNGSLFAGYGMYFGNHFYLGLEAFGEISSLQGNHDTFSSTNIVTNEEGVTSTFLATTQTHLQARLKNNYGVILTPGVQFTNEGVMLYGIVGWVQGNFSVNANQIDSPISEITGAQDVAAKQSFGRSVNGFELGLGLDVPITQISRNLSLRVDYKYDNYSQFSNTKQATLTTMPDSFTTDTTLATESINVKPRVNTIGVGVVWRFNG